MSSASFGIRASVPFQNPPGIPPDVIPIFGGPKADIEWRVVQNWAITPGTVAVGPWNRSGGLKITRASNGNYGIVTFRTKEESRARVNALLRNGTVIYATWFDIFRNGSTPNYLIYPFQFNAASGGLISRGGIVTSPSNQITGTQITRQFSFTVNAPSNDVQYLEFSAGLSSASDTHTINVRLGFIGYSLP